jgi:transposase
MVEWSGQNMDMRELKALELAARSRITFEGGVWLVPSQTSPSTRYRVTLKPPTCDCEDFQLRQEPCKHVIAARLVAERSGGEQAPALDTDVIPKRPTYKQDWPAYALAQKTEKRRLQVLLRDLCRNLPERERPEGKRGPKPHLPSDAVFSMAFKVYCGLSSRRFSCDLLDAHEKGHISRPIPGAKVTAFFEDAYFTPILKALIAYSARPLRVVEKDFAIDSSGFGSSRYEKWYDQKYGVTRQKCLWVKVHLAVGVKTHVVTAVRILDKDAGDSPQFVPLVKETRRQFEIGEVSADKAYASLENFEEIAGMGGTAFIAFKENTTGGVGGMFEKMFHFYQFKRDEYLASYHKRSNVESTFSAIKRKFGDSVMSKTDTAMANEALCKILCHNLTCLIQEQETLGIAPIFWQDEARQEGTPVILSMVRAQ